MKSGTGGQTRERTSKREKEIENQGIRQEKEKIREDKTQETERQSKNSIRK